MKKVKQLFDNVTDWIGEKVFSKTEERKRKQYATWLLVALICMALMSVVRYRAAKELQQYQRIADAYSILLEE